MEDLLQDTQVQAAIVAAIVLVVTKAASAIVTLVTEWQKRKQSRNLDALMKIGRGVVEEVYTERVRPAKAANGGKLTDDQKAEFNALAVGRIEATAESSGLSPAKILRAAAKVVLPSLVSSLVKQARGRL